MPELPEAETVVRTLENLISHKTISDIKVIYERIIDCDRNDFMKLIGQSFNGFHRRGKYLVFEMDDCLFVSHLRMEGKYFYYDKHEKPNKHTHVVFVMDDGSELHYNDVRKFGRMEVVPKDADLSNFHGLGPEPFSDEFDFNWCKSFLSTENKTIKEILLEQKLVCGAGNIYADEICYAIGVHPSVKGSSLTDEEITNLIDETKRILGEAIKAGGTTIRSYTSSLGVTGRFQLSLKCHTKDFCPNCQSRIIKTRIGGRGTYYCPKCQKMKNMKVAITGTIGSGKSTVSSYLRELGYDVFDCDKYNASLLEKGAAGYREIKKAFPDCVNADGLDKKMISSIVFNDPEKKKLLESILHPMIVSQMMNSAYEKDLFFAEVPLLFESGLESLFDKTIVVATDEDIALNRLLKRGLSFEESKSRIRNQLSVSVKIAKADYCLYNNGSLDDLYRDVDQLIKEELC